MTPSPHTPPPEWQPNLDWITDTLAIGGSFPTERAVDLAREHQVTAVIDLRSESRDDEAAIMGCGMTFLHLPTDDHHAVSPAMLDEGVAFAMRHLVRGERVLVHCEHGIGRSATLALCVLVETGLAPLDALERAKSRRRLVSPSPAQYAGWAAWLAERGRRRERAIAIPSFDEFAAIAYRHLAGR